MSTILNNRYRILQALGSGGCSQTFLAEDTHLPSKRRCVIKQLKPFSDDPAAYQVIKGRFEREAVVLENFGKSNDQIPELYAYIAEGGQFYLVQEWIEGTTLTQKVREQGPLTEGIVRNILVSLLPILEYVHSQRVIHRDIKPDNIIIRLNDEQPVLIDFGIVKEVLDVDALGNFANSIMIGTRGFMPLEQAAGKPVYSSDLYGLGMTAICLLTGKPPKDLIDPQSGEMLWRKHAPSISEEFASILDKSIQSLIRDRYSSASEMLSVLQSHSADTIIPIKVKKIKTDPPNSSVFSPELPISESFTFKIVTLDESGIVVGRQSRQTSFFVEDLGNGIALEMVEIPGGVFIMGEMESEIEQVKNEYIRYGGGRPIDTGNLSRNESGQQQLTVPSFFIGKFQVTQAQWKAVAQMKKVNIELNPEPSFFKGLNLPVEQVSWEDSLEFCARLSKQTRRQYRLPSEAQWEYACRAKTITPFTFGETITTDLVNYDGNYPYRLAPKTSSLKRTMPVGSLGIANGFGLYDVHGNVWEWCLDLWHYSYVNTPSESLLENRGLEMQYRVVRGGAWNSVGHLCRSGLRFRNIANNRYSSLGFRVVAMVGWIQGVSMLSSPTVKLP